VFGFGYTVFSEWLNVVVRKSWAYSDLMPVISIFGLSLGVSPLLQWMAVPTLALYVSRRAGASAMHNPETDTVIGQQQIPASRKERT